MAARRTAYRVLNEPLWSTRSRGFADTRPAQGASTSIQRPHRACARCRPLLADGSFPEAAEADAARFEPLTNLIASEKSLDRLGARAHALYGYIGKGYVHGHVDGDGAAACAAIPLHGLARREQQDWAAADD